MYHLPESGLYIFLNDKKVHVYVKYENKVILFP